MSMPVLSSFNDELYDAYVIFQEGDDYTEIGHKICQFGVGGAVPLKLLLIVFPDTSLSDTGDEAVMKIHTNTKIGMSEKGFCFVFPFN